jgi:probable H4MPT-linked C1 transfer pathway protein
MAIKTAPDILGLDIGGANLKAVHADRTAVLHPFALWQHPHQLASELRELLERMPACDVPAVTMTGEICDCFPTKSHGVQTILDAVEQVADGWPVLVWTTEGRFIDLAAARQAPLLAAAANWLALATLAGRFVREGPALLIDIGSTTTDLIPLLDGRPVPVGRTDTARLQSSELVYTGVERTPVCALLGNTVMAELFATTRDVYVMLGDLPESLETNTADGRPATRAHAQVRLARMLGGDGETCTAEEVMSLARQAASVQQTLLQYALRRVARSLPGPPAKFIVCGSGEFLARRVLAREHVPEDRLLSLSSQLGSTVSAAACAYAVAVLAGEQHDA